MILIPSYLQALQIRAQAFRELQKDKEAIALLKQAHEIEPENEVIQFMLEEAQTEWDEDNKLAIGRYQIR